jgi:hypothetical protein
MNQQAHMCMVKSEYSEARQINTQIAQETSPEPDLAGHAFALLNMANIDVMPGRICSRCFTPPKGCSRMLIIRRG